MKCLLLLSLLTPLTAGAAEPFKLKDGDRVVFVGSTLIEREQRYGYWETALTQVYPDRNITFRNLGWSGDTVWGEARAGFDAPAVGYKRLVEQTLALKPTVIFLGYGTNESFAGKEGLERFQKQLEKLLLDLDSSKARVVLIGPPPVDRHLWPSESVEARNRDIKLYGNAIQQTAAGRGAVFVSTLFRDKEPDYPWTDNGLHMTAAGYWHTSQDLLNGLDLGLGRLTTRVELEGQRHRRLLHRKLPPPPEPAKPGTTGFQKECTVLATDLPPGKYTLRIDGRPVQTADALRWMDPLHRFGLAVTDGPSLEQVEKLRQTIVEKNQLFFHRYRPQNETYLFGFRKHEQGQNAKEIAQFDPLIEKLEKEIARLRVPVEHTYELVPAGEEKK